MIRAVLAGTTAIFLATSAMAQSDTTRPANEPSMTTSSDAVGTVNPSKTTAIQSGVSSAGVGGNDGTRAGSMDSAVTVPVDPARNATIQSGTDGIATKSGSIGSNMETNTATGTVDPGKTTDTVSGTNDAGMGNNVATSGAATLNSGQTFVTTRSMDDMLASNWIGKTVVNSQDESIGSIDDLVVDSSGRVTAAIISVGGFLGIGAKDVAISMHSLQPVRDGSGGVRITTVLTRDDLSNAPGYASMDDAGGRVVAPTPRS